jgi:prephenate dehydrogenase
METYAAAASITQPRLEPHRTSRMTKHLADCRVAIVGLGLMGASLAMDLTQNKLCREVRGVARRTATVLDAFFAGAVDLATNDLHTGVMGADIVILATPVRTIVDQLAEIAPALWPGTIVMDMGSTKGEICDALDNLPDHCQPIGGHPMTGKETAGFGAAEPGLYRNATWVLSPLPRTTETTVTLATELVEAVGARPVRLGPARHDRLVATISHLPFLAASALVHTTLEVGSDDPKVWELAAGGFRDTSRVAASDTRMFMDILMTNRPAVLAQLDDYIAQLEELRGLLNAQDEAQLSVKLAQSQAARAAWKPSR